MSILRGYQSDMIEQARALMRRGIRSIILEAPTGAGKTLLTAHMVKSAAAKGLRSFFLMHRVELIDQAAREFQDVGVDFGIISAGYTMEPWHSTMLCSIGTLRRRMDRIKAPDLIIFDEAHHCPAKTNAEIHEAYPKAYHIGLTATPERLDGKGLGSYYKEMVKGPAVRWLIEQGFLADYRLIVPPSLIDTTGIHRQMGDFNKHELAEAASESRIVGDAVKEYRKYAMGKRALCRHVNIEQSKRLAAEFNANGIPALHIDGKTPRLERRQAVKDFAAGKVLVLSNVELFGEGFNVPAVQCVIDLRPTQSLTLARQFWGRALRPKEDGSKAIILDLAGNFNRHGLPCEEKEWSLQGRAGAKKSGPSILTTQCPKCYAVMLGRPVACAECGHVFEVGEGRTVEQVEGELVEADVDALRIAKISRKREIQAARTMPELLALAKKLGYARGWAWFTYNARRQKQGATT